MVIFKVSDGRGNERDVVFHMFCWTIKIELFLCSVTIPDFPGCVTNDRLQIMRDDVLEFDLEFC